MSKLTCEMKRVRKEYGLTQKQLSNQLTVGQPYLSNVENEKAQPTKMFVRLFCLLYSIDENSLLD